MDYYCSATTWAMTSFALHAKMSHRAAATGVLGIFGVPAAAHLARKISKQAAHFKRGFHRKRQ